jgi:hypothetical protein
MQEDNTKHTPRAAGDNFTINSVCGDKRAFDEENQAGALEFAVSGRWLTASGLIRYQ